MCVGNVRPMSWMMSVSDALLSYTRSLWYTDGFWILSSRPPEKSCHTWPRRTSGMPMATRRFKRPGFLAMRLRSSSPLFSSRARNMSFCSTSDLPAPPAASYAQ